jgi:hypothetical protein
VRQPSACLVDHSTSWDGTHFCNYCSNSIEASCEWNVNALFTSPHTTDIASEDASIILQVGSRFPLRKPEVDLQTPELEVNPNTFKRSVCIARRNPHAIWRVTRNRRDEVVRHLSLPVEDTLPICVAGCCPPAIEISLNRKSVRSGESGRLSSAANSLAHVTCRKL